ncbi:MAG: hypothetical protein ACRD11_15685 [Terriglobia bacterium]
MIDRCPGLNRRRLVSLIGDAIRRCQLDLREKTVVTEAASGAYAATALMAAMAGAKRVFALGGESPYGSVGEIHRNLVELAAIAEVRNRIELVEEKSREVFAGADIVTNAGHIRPIDAEVVRWLPPTAVVPLMYEAWEFREQDVDVAECSSHGIAVAGTNESHPAVDVFSFLGMMAVKLLHDGGVAVYGSRVLLLCDNPFLPYIERTLRAAGAVLTVASDALALREHPGSGCDALLIGMRPGPQPVIGGPESLLPADLVNQFWPGAVVAQFWGDIDRSALDAARAPYWPLEAPARCHMGILPSALGPEPIVRLQAGGLKVGEVMSKAAAGEDRVRCAVDSGYGQALPAKFGDAAGSSQSHFRAGDGQ